MGRSRVRASVVALAVLLWAPAAESETRTSFGVHVEVAAACGRMACMVPVVSYSVSPPAAQPRPDGSSPSRMMEPAILVMPFGAADGLPAGISTILTTPRSADLLF